MLGGRPAPFRPSWLLLLYIGVGRLSDEDAGLMWCPKQSEAPRPEGQGFLERKLIDF